MIVSLSHYDLDGISSQIVLRNYLGECTKMNIGYNKIDEYINIIEDICVTQRPSEVWVTDLSFSIKQLTNLSDVTKDFSYIKFYFIDHHPFKEDYSHLKSSNFKIIISKKACATKLINLYIKKNFNVKESKSLDRYVEFVNAYDIWLEDAPDFSTGFMYNELFWSYGLNHFWSRFKDNHNTNDSDLFRYSKLLKEKELLYKKVKDNNRMIELRNKEIFIIFIDDFNSHITIDFKGYKCYLIINSLGKASVRLKSIDNMEVVQAKIFEGIEKLQNIKNFGGHIGAFGINLEDNEPSKIIEFTKSMMYILDKALDS